MKSGFIYLAAPIDQAPVSRSPGNVGKLERYVKQRGWGIYDPALAWQAGDRQEPSPVIQQINDRALGLCRGMIALLPPGVPTIGVPLEIERAAQAGKPVLVLGGAGSWALSAITGIRVAKPGEEIEELVEWLIDQAGHAQDPKPILPFKQIREGEEATLPRRHYSGDAGLDLVVSQTTTIAFTGITDVPCNLAVELPADSFGLLIGRSSTARTKRLHVHTTVVDSGFRGELFAMVSSLDGKVVTVSAGERLAQLVVLPNLSMGLRPELVEQLSVSDRGPRGFGSSGV